MRPITATMESQMTAAPKRPKPGLPAGMKPLTVRLKVGMAMLGIGKTKFHELINAGLVEVIDVGGMRLARVESLERLVKGRTSKSKSQESQATT
jgi:hypothetical protein